MKSVFLALALCAALAGCAYAPYGDPAYSPAGAAPVPADGSAPAVQSPALQYYPPYVYPYAYPYGYSYPYVYPYAYAYPYPGPYWYDTFWLSAGFRCCSGHVHHRRGPARHGSHGHWGGAGG